MKTSKRNFITDPMWKKLSPHLPAERGRSARPCKENRPMVEAMIWKLRVGCPWRDLPKEFGPWESVYTRFSRWTEQGIFEKIFAEVKDHLSCDDMALDSTTVRAHQHAHGAAKKKGGKK
jgi:transposase